MKNNNYITILVSFIWLANFEAEMLCPKINETTRINTLIFVSKKIVMRDRMYNTNAIELYILLPNDKLAINGSNTGIHNHPWHYIFRYNDGDSSTLQLVASNALGNNNAWRYIDTTIKLSDLPPGTNTISIERVPPRNNAEGMKHPPVMHLTISHTQPSEMTTRHIALDYSLSKDSVLHLAHKRFKPSSSKYHDIIGLLENPTSINVRNKN